MTRQEGALRVGDEFVVRMPGPWDGPIRVIEVTPTSFRFATLAGHLEAGQIEWRATDEDGLLRFEIESWARGGDRWSYLLLHDRLRMAKEDPQLYMWTRHAWAPSPASRRAPRRRDQIETRRASSRSLRACPSSC